MTSPPMSTRALAALAAVAASAVTVADLTLTVTPLLEDQELETDVMDYWEGAAVVSGDVTGRAYVELTGY